MKGKHKSKKKTPSNFKALREEDPSLRTKKRKSKEKYRKASRWLEDDWEMDYLRDEAYNRYEEEE